MNGRFGRLAICTAALVLAAGTARAGHRGRNVSIQDDDPATCQDIRVDLDGREALRAEERAAIGRPAGRFRVDAARNSGVRIREEDRADFEVVLCKAAASPEALAEIVLERSGDSVSVRGPRGDENDWVGYLLIAAPRQASLEVRASNGPIGLSGLSGLVVARSQNGPISASDCSGQLDLEAQNGPIAFRGAGGHSTLRTQNGPIGVVLEGQAWNGEGIDARAVNGPVSLKIPSGYRSGTIVESLGRSPFQCQGEACAAARRTWDDEHRRIELGDGPTLVRLSTENGPVSVRTGAGAGADDED